MDARNVTLTPVQEFYRDQTVFVTGGTGFMGKVLLEKLLYACPLLRNVYVLMRPKRAKSIEGRLEEMFKLPLFQRIRDECPQVLNKIVPLNGDISSNDLGLSSDERQTLYDNVSIVFHMAATLKLEATLKDALDMNLTGTQRVIELCSRMQKLRSFVHLSTAFCNCDQPELGERIYEFAHQPADLVNMAEWIDTPMLERIKPDLIRPHSNSYTYSKRLAEILVRQQFPRMPVAVVRPAIVTPAWSQPVPGWVDNLNGPTGILAGAAKGVIRTMLIDGDNIATIIPVDMAINGLITIPYDIERKRRATGQTAEMPVYNVTCGANKVVRWKEVLQLGERTNGEFPIEAGVWYPGGSMTTSVALHRIRSVLYHWLPAYVIDALLFCFGQKRFMCRVQQKVSTGLEMLSFFTLRKWNFRSEEYDAIYTKLTEEDKKLFDMNMVEVDVPEYIKRCILGGRQYCLKEPLSTLPKARLQMKAMYVLDCLAKLFLFWLVVSTLMKWTGLDAWFT